MNKDIKSFKHEYDVIAEEVFFPIYDVITNDIIKATKITSGVVLDVGCGGGHLGYSLLQKTDMNGIFHDINEDAIETAKERGYKLNLSDRCTYYVGNVENLDIPSCSVDLVISRGSVGFWDNLIKAFSEIYRVLKSGGYAYIGGGLGSKELIKEIYEKMPKYNPTWPNSVKKKTKGYTVDDYKSSLDSLEIKHIIIDDRDDKGRWIIIEKI